MVLSLLMVLPIRPSVLLKELPYRRREGGREGGGGRRERDGKE